MHYQVPQFIDVEDKIIGPLTLKQFFYLAIAFLISFFSFFVLKFFVWLIVVFLVFSLALAFAFVKYNGRSFIVLIRSIFFYFWRPRSYIWQKEIPTKSVPSGVLSDLNLKLETSTHPLKRERFLKFPLFKKFMDTKEKFDIFRKNTGEREVARRIDYR